jgi:hypothetical protein
MAAWNDVSHVETLHRAPAPFDAPGIPSHQDWEVGQVDQAKGSPAETYNPWTVVNIVFSHLAAEGLHPVLGQPGDPSAPAAELLRMLGIEPAAQGDRQGGERIQDRLSQLRQAVFGGE